MYSLDQLTSGALAAGDFGVIKRLQISEGLTEFPKEIFDLADTLEILDLSNNQLSSLPDDLGRLTHLKIIFLSNNRFDHVPEVLATCPALEMIGIKANQVRVVAEDCLPEQTRWLILTDNEIETLPNSIGKLHRLQKLALAGNQLSSLPDSMANCRSLELARLSANCFRSMPDWLFQLPKLTWLAFDGNPCTQHHLSDADSLDGKIPSVVLADLELAEKLGEGASGHIYKAHWINQPDSLRGSARTVAVKVFKGEVTSDGFPADEVRNCLSAGHHLGLINVIAQVSDGNDLALVMELIPNGYRNLGLPPSLDTCTRDTFAKCTAFSAEQVALITHQMADILAHLHVHQVSHGDAYAHNTMINELSSVLFGDFGAATDLSSLPSVQREAMELIEVRALGCLIDDLLSRVSDQTELAEQLRTISNACLQSDQSLRPMLKELEHELGHLYRAQLERES